MAKSEQYRSCKGTARYAFISRPDTKFDANGKFSVDLELDPSDDDAKTFLGLLKSKLTAEFSHPPFREQKDKDGNKTGLYIVKFSSSYKPKVFDGYGHIIPEDVQVGNGSIVAIAYAENFYPGFGGGLSLYLNAVQVIDLVEYTGGNAESYGFDVMDNINEDPAPFEGGESLPENDSDNLPF